MAARMPRPTRLRRTLTIDQDHISATPKPPSGPPAVGDQPRAIRDAGAIAVVGDEDRA